MAIALVVIAAGAMLAVVLDQGPGRSATKTVTLGATRTVPVTMTVTQFVAAPGTTAPAEPQGAGPTEPGYKLRWKGPLRLNQSGHDLGGPDGPSSQSNQQHVQLNYDGTINFSDVTVAKWDSGNTPSPSQCVAQGNTQNFSSDEAREIRPKAGLLLCLTLEADDGSTRIGYMRVRSGYTQQMVNVDGVLWDKL